MRFYFIRHGRTEWNSNKKVMGRLPVPLNGEGAESVRRTASRLDGEGIELILSSTLRRALETAGILSDFWGVEVRREKRLDESAFEGWTGKTYMELENDPDFTLYRNKPALADFSKNEGMKEIQARVVQAVEDALKREEAERVALVSHSDVIKPALAYYLRMDLNDMHRLVISNASVSLLEINPGSVPRLRYINLLP